MTIPFMQIRDLSLSYGRTLALRGVDLDVEQGTIVALIGANGAGKTSLLRAISGLEAARGGSIRLGRHEIRGEAAHRIAARGVAHAPEGRRLFGRMTVAENLTIGGWRVRDGGELRRRREDVLRMFPRLAQRLGQPAALLSGGEQQMAAIARALMARPQLLLLDEPSMGLAPMFVATIFRIIEELRREGITILLVEQNAKAALEIADAAYVLETGRIVLSGPAKEIAADPAVSAAYLGG